jgi:hypothetical protein
MEAAMHDPPRFLLPDPLTRRWLAPMTDDPVLAVWTADQAARVELLGVALIGLLLGLLALHAWSLVDRARRRRIGRDLDPRPVVLEADRVAARMAQVRDATTAPEDERAAVRPRHEGGRPGLYPMGAASG